MANKEHLQILKQGVKAWNRWRDKHPAIEPDLCAAHLYGAELVGADLRRANLRDAHLIMAKLRRANLAGADLTAAELGLASLTGANLTRAWLAGTVLRQTTLWDVNFSRAALVSANFSGADLSRANFKDTVIIDTNFGHATVGDTIFSNTDLSEVLRLESVQHTRPSEISISTIYRSQGRIPESFLRGCGVPESFIVQIPALVAAAQPIQFYSCFISYSGRDDEFARRLHSRMREAELRVWFAPEDIKGGDKLYDQIDRAIQVHERLLLVLSESSMQSRWVELEIRRARKVELREGRRKLFPIRLVGYEALKEWVCIDSATGEDLAEEVRGYFIPDFSDWKSHDDFERAFARLLADLKASAGQDIASDKP